MTKIIAESSSDSADARAARLRRIRNLANLTRKEMCARSGIKLDTLIGWEVARHGGLTENGAKKIIDCIAGENVQCTLSWLLHERGPSPIVLPQDAHFKTTLKHDATDILLSEEKLISNELHLFHAQYPDAMSYKVEDDAMSPHYLVNDYVAGVKRASQKISPFIGYDCIVQLEDGKILLRCLHEGTIQNKYTLLCHNTKTTSSMPVLHDVKLIYVAPVIWMRRKNPE